MVQYLHIPASTMFTKIFPRAHSSRIPFMKPTVLLARRHFGAAPPCFSRLLTTPTLPPRQTSAMLIRRLMSNSSKKSTSDKMGATAKADSRTWWQRFLGPKPMPARHTFGWYKEVMLICTVFAITGSSTMMLVRPAVRDILHLEGSMKDGPWSYRICSLIVMSPIYGMLLVCVGTVFGRHFYFRYFAVKIFSRMGIPPEMLDKNFKETSKHFKRW